MRYIIKLVRRMLNKATFKILFDKYFDTIRGFAYYRCSDADTASDIAQDVFLKVWEKREQLSNDNIKSLLYKMANDMVISNYRKEASQSDFAQSMTIQNNAELSPEDEMLFGEFSANYAQALNQMPETQRTVFLMSRNDELKYHEIAQCLEISVKAVEKRMSAALQFLRTQLLYTRNKMKTDNIKIIPKWKKSKDDIWNETFANLEDTKVVKKVRYISFLKYAAAAVITLVVAGTSFAYLYTETETAARGTHLAISLPDGSSVNLNAESELKYKPFWWFASRDVKLNGEAYFEVKSGSQFTVESGQNQVKVLGTSFNIFARAEKYSVTCLTGKVEVSANKGTVILNPNMQANLSNCKLTVNEKFDASQTIGWTQNRFSFIGVPLIDVVEEVERQYDINVTTTSKLDYLYTGNFSKAKQP